MISNKIKSLFQFIEFLHSNIEKFIQYEDLLNELQLLKTTRKNLQPRKKVADKLKYDEVQIQIENKFGIINKNVVTPIKEKATELNICDPYKTETLWNWNIDDIYKLHENFSIEDLPEISTYDKYYKIYRTETKKETFFSLEFFFNGLDEILKILFDYFNDPSLNIQDDFTPIKYNFKNAITEYSYYSTEFTIDLFNHFLSYEFEIGKKKCIITPQPLNYLFQEFPFVIDAGTYTFKSCYTKSDKEHKVILSKLGMEYPNFEVVVEISEAYIEAKNSKNNVEIYRKLWYNHLIKCFQETERTSIDKEQLRQNYLFVYSNLLEHKGAFNEYDKTLLIEYVKILGIDEGEQKIKEEFYWIRFFISCYLAGRGNYDIQAPLKERYKVQALAYWDFLKWLKAENEKPQIKKQPPFKQETPKTFEELFYNPDLVKPCLDILKNDNLHKPLIDIDNNYIGNSKGAFCVWIDELQKQGIIKHYTDRNIFAQLLPQKIKNFTIAGSMFPKHHTQAEKSYRSDFKALISKIKLY